MATFAEAQQAVSVVVHHRNFFGRVPGASEGTRRGAVATWTDGPVSRDTDELTREQADELVELGAEDERDPDA